MGVKFIPFSFRDYKGDSIHYDGRAIFSYGTPIVSIIGARRIGKTFTCKHKIIKDFLSKGYKFVWLRDNDEARRRLAENKGAKFFSDMSKIPSKSFKELNGEIDGNTIKINGETAGYLMPCSTFQNYKGNDFEEIKNIVYDEFIPERNKRNTGHSGWEAVNSILTIASYRKDLRIMFLANALDRGNEILQIFGINIKEYGIYVNREKGVSLHYADNNPKFDMKRKDSIMGKLLAGTEYEANLFNNKFADDANQMVDKRPAKAKLICCLHGYDYTSIRLYLADGLLYVWRDINKDAHPNSRYVNDITLVTTRLQLITPDLLKAIKNSFALKQVYFENAFCRNTFIDIIKRR